MTYKNLNIYALYIILVSVAVVMSFPIFGYTTDDPGKSESEPLVIEPPPEYTIGFKSLPVEIRSRWLSLVTDQKNIEFVEFFDEGDRIISKIGETVILSGGVAPETDQGAYKLFISLQNRLVSLIDKISLNIIVSFPDMDLDSLLKENMNQRSQVSSNVIEDRKLLLASGLELIEEHRRDPMFMKYPDRTSAFAGLYFSVAELLYQESYEAFFLDTDEYINQLNILMETDPDAVASLTLPEPDYSEVLAIYQKIVDQFPSSDYSDDALYNIGFLTSEGSGKSNLKNANRIFETLLRLYPETDYKLNTLRRIGEYYFMPPVTNLEKAVEIFTRICEEYSDSEFYQEALYKLGWTYYRMDDIPASVEHFAQVLDYNFRPVDEIASTVNILDVSAESMNYIGICYSIDINQWNDAGIENMVVWLQENPERMENYGKELILQLGEIYRVQNAQFREAVAIYKKYISLFPNDHRAPEVQDYIVDIFQKGEIIDPIEAHLEKINYYDTYNPDSEWWSFNNDSKIKKEVSLKLESYLDMIIDEVLVIAIDENDQSELNKFESYSRQYLRFWPKGPNAYKIHFKLATALENNLNQPMEAVKEYWQIVNQYDDTTHREISCGRIVANVQTFVKREKNEEIWISPLGELLSPEMKEEYERALEEIADSLQAIENAEIDSFAIGDSLVLTEVGIDDSLTQELELTEELVLDSLVASVDSDTTKIEPEEEIAEIEMDEETAPEPEKEDEAVKRVNLLNSEKLLLSGFDLFVGLFPTSALAPKMLFQAGNMLFENNQFPESRFYLDKLIESYPEESDVEDAFKIYLEGHFKSKEYDKVEQINKRIAESGLSSELTDFATNRKAQSLYLNAKDLLDSENHLEAAKEFRRVALETPDYEDADRSLFLSGQEFRQAKAWVEAKDAFLLMVEMFPQSDRADGALYNVAFDLQKELNDNGESARIYERLVNEYPNSKMVQDALANASYNYNSIADHESVIRINELYVSRFPNADDADVYLFENADHWLKLGMVEKANSIYKRFTDRYPKDPRTIQAFFERASYFLSKGNQGQASAEFSKTVSSHKKLVNDGSTGNPRYASLALAQLLEWEYAEYEQLSYNLPESSKNTSKARKKEWRNQLSEKYQELLGFNRKEGYIAFYKMASLDDELALVNYNQEMRFASTVDQRIDQLSELVNESILLNSVAVQSYRSGIESLSSIVEQLTTQQLSLQEEYETFSEIVIQMQKDEAEGVTDSLAKQTLLSRSLTELDSALLLGKKWKDLCSSRIPEISSRNGFYLDRMWQESIKYTGSEYDPDLRMLFREEILNSSVSPIGQEVIGLHLQAMNIVQEFGVEKDYKNRLEDAVSTTVETALLQYIKQCDKARERAEMFISQYVVMIPNGEDAESPDGFYPDEMGIMIQDQLDYLNNFALDYMLAFSGIMDTIRAYELPIGFANESIDQSLQFVLDQGAVFQNYIEDAEEKRKLYSSKYDETDEIQYDDANIAFEDVAVYCADYHLALMEEGMRLKQNYDILGQAGLEILKRLIREDPEMYAEDFNLGSKSEFAVSETDWLIWHSFENGFETFDFADEDWKYSNLGRKSYEVDLGILDSLDAKPLWFWMESPYELEGTLEGGTGESEQIEGILTEEADLDEETDTSEIAQFDEDSLLLTEEELTDTLTFVDADTSLVIEGTLDEELPVEEESFTEVETPTYSLADQLAWAEEDSIWRIWVEPDSMGVRKYFFRKKFDISSKPTKGTIWISADDNFSLFINEVYIAADDADTIDWMDIKEYDISDYLQLGENLIAIGAADVDSSRHGLTVGLVYEAIPDIEDQLDQIIENEIRRQQDISVSDGREPSLDEIRRMRIIEKNKLR